MPFGAIIGAGIGLLGSSMQADAASAGAASNLEAARIAAEAQKFRPVGVTTRFGTSTFGTDANGNVNTAGYTLSPEIAAMRDRLLSSAGTTGLGLGDQGLAAASGLFGLGSKYLASTPQEAAQKWMTDQQALLAPGREQAWANLRQADYGRGTTGLKVAQGTSYDMANPYASALANAQLTQDRQLAADATTQGMNQVKFGAGLFGTGADIASGSYNPFKTQFGLGQNLESAGQGALDLGINIGGKTTQAAANAADTIYRAQTNLNNTNSYSPLGSMFMGAASNPAITNGFANWMGGLPNKATMLSNNATMFNTPNYLDAAGQLPMLDYSGFQWGQ